MKANSYVKVTSWQEAYKLMKESPKNKVLGGGLWLKKGGAEVDKLIDLSKLGLDKIEEKGDYISVGALVSLRRLETDPLTAGIANGLIKEAVSQIIGPAFRNSATIGGTVYGKLGFSDLLTALLTIGGKVVFYPAAEIDLKEYLEKPGFYDGVLTHVLIKNCKPKSFFKKVIYTSLDYPIVNIGVKKCLKEDKYNIAVGSRPQVAAIPAKAVEYLNNGGKDFKKAAEIAVDELKFGDSVGVKADYRKELVKVYIERGLEEVSK